MASPSKISSLPSAVKAWIDQELVTSGFGDYTNLTALLNQKLEAHDLEISISRTGLGNYGKTLKNRIEKIRASTEAAKLLNETIDDDGDALAIANIAMSQDIIFQIMSKIDPEDDGKESKINIKEISMLFRALGNISRASLPLKKWNIKVREELARKTEAAAEQISQVEGLTDEQANKIRAKILGINLDG